MISCVCTPEGCLHTAETRRMDACTQLKLDLKNSFQVIFMKFGNILIFKIEDR